MPDDAPTSPGTADPRVLAFAATTTGILVTDPTRPDNPIVEANPAFERLTGYTRAEVLGRNCRLLQGPGTDRAAVARIREAVTAGRDVRETVLNYRKDGTSFWNELRITAARDGAGAVTHLVGVQTDVTARVEAERDLLQAVLDQLPDAVWVKDAASRFVRLNRATAAELGMAESAAAIGKTDRDFFPPALAREYRADEERVLTTGEPLLGKLERQGEGRGARWVLASKAPLRGRDGRIVGLVGVNRDITERREAEASLGASEERLRLALEAAGMATWDWDAATGRVVRSARMPALYGLAEPPSEEGDRYLGIVHLDDRSLWLEADRLLLEEGADYAVEYRVVRPDGEVRWLREVSEATRDARGRPVRVLEVTQDVTDRRRAEEEVRAAAAWFRTLVEELPALVYVEDLDAVEAAGSRPHSYTSPRVAALLGFDPDEWEGAPGLWRARLHPEDHARVLAEDARTEATGEPFRYEYRLLAKDGRVVWLRDEAVLVRGPGGEARFWLGLQLDITAEKAAEAALVDAKESAEAASRAKSAFLSTMSHELRSPLTAILGYAELLRYPGGDPLTPGQAADVAQIVRSADHLLALIDDVLDLSLIEAGGVALEPEEVDLGRLVGAVLADVALQAAAKGLTVAADVPPGLPVQADPLRLHQVLLNLAGNAVKFTEQGRVTVAARRVEGGFEVAVADTGIGIAPEALPHVFEEFRRADPSTTRRYGGSGLGLAIAKRIVEAHGGMISAESAPGVGSTFTVRLPAAR